MSDDGERVAVRTYVPRYQRDAWDAEAERLDMSRSEFVRAMVQAGRRDFGLEGRSADADDSRDGEHALEDRVLELLRGADPLGWDELLARLADDLEDRLDEALGALQDENRIRHAGRAGGYALAEDADE